MRNCVKHCLGGVVAAIFAALCVPAARADERCKLERYASLDLIDDAGGPVGVSMQVNGETLRMLVATGGVYSSLNPDVAERLHLRLEDMAQNRVQVVESGGRRPEHYAISDSITLAGMTQQKFAFVVRADPLKRFEGTIGPDILATYDLEFDFANKKLNLFKHVECDGNPVYWTRAPAARVRVELGRGHLLLPVELDGTAMQAVISTGTEFSMLVKEHAHDLFGAKIDGAQLDPATGLTKYRFNSLKFGGVSLDGISVRLVPQDEIAAERQYMQLGMDVLRKLHLFVAYRAKYVYFTGVDAH